MCLEVSGVSLVGTALVGWEWGVGGSWWELPQVREPGSWRASGDGVEWLWAGRRGGTSEPTALCREALW